MRRAFTLIEMMIAIALISILLAGQLELLGSSRSLRRQKDLLDATRQAEKQLKRLQKIPFDQLPPQLLKADAQGWVRLGQPDFQADSLQLSALEGPRTPLVVDQVESVKGRVHLQYRGLLLVNYACYLSDQGELQRVGADGSLTLENGPPVRVESIFEPQGERLTPFRDWSLEAGGLRLGPSARGRLLMLDYRGGRRANLLTSSFVDEQMRPQTAPSRYKLLRLREIHGQHEVMTVTSLRIGP